MLAALKYQAKRLKGEVAALAYAQRHPDTPRVAKVVALCVVAYALSPIDLIPDFIPVLGLLDDLILLPLGLYLAVQLVPERVMAEARERARASSAKPHSLAGAAVVVLIWLVLAGLSLRLLFGWPW